MCETREDEAWSGGGWHLTWLVGSPGRCSAWRASPWAPGCPRDLGVRSSRGQGGCKYLHIPAGGTRHVHTSTSCYPDLRQHEACLPSPPGSVLSGFFLWSGYRDSTAALFLGLSSLSLFLFLAVELKSFSLHIQQVLFCPFPREHGKRAFSFLQQNRCAVIHNRKWSNLSVSKYLFFLLLIPQTNRLQM